MGPYFLSSPGFSREYWALPPSQLPSNPVSSVSSPCKVGHVALGVLSHTSALVVFLKQRVLRSHCRFGLRMGCRHGTCGSAAIPMRVTLPIYDRVVGFLGSERGSLLLLHPGCSLLLGSLSTKRAFQPVAHRIFPSFLGVCCTVKVPRRGGDTSFLPQDLVMSSSHGG